MAKSRENNVFKLISTLNKAEKRYFQLFAKRNQNEGEIFFLKLFDVYSKYGLVADEVILKKIKGIKAAQLSNIRNNLYRQLLTSLRLQHQKTNADIAIRQEIDFAKVLYNKGLYRQALDILHKAKALAQTENRNVLALEVLFFEKAIESQNITKSIGNRASELVNDSATIYNRLKETLHYSNLDLELYAYYLNNNFCTSKEEVEQLNQRFLNAINDLSVSHQDFYSGLYYYQCMCWYNYIKQDFSSYYQNAKQWVNLFQEQPNMAEQRPTFYLKGVHNCISGAFMNTDEEGYLHYFNLLKAFKHTHPKKMTWNEQGIYDLYVNMHEIDLHFSRGTFTDYLTDLSEINYLIEENPYHWDTHRIAVFRYKLACLHIGVKDYKSAVGEFNEIRQLYKPGSRSTVLRFVRILSAFSHLEMGNMRLVNSAVQALKKDLATTKHLHEPLQRTLLKLLEKLTQVGDWGRQKEIENALQQIKSLKKDPFAQVAFLHFYAEEWLTSLLTNTEAHKVLEEKYEARRIK